VLRCQDEGPEAEELPEEAGQSSSERDSPGTGNMDQLPSDSELDNYSPSSAAKRHAPKGWLQRWDFMTKSQRRFALRAEAECDSSSC
jgi:hypothetical protein